MSIYLTLEKVGNAGVASAADIGTLLLVSATAAAAITRDSGTVGKLQESLVTGE